MAADRCPMAPKRETDGQSSGRSAISAAHSTSVWAGSGHLRKLLQQCPPTKTLTYSTAAVFLIHGPKVDVIAPPKSRDETAVFKLHFPALSFVPSSFARCCQTKCIRWSRSPIALQNSFGAFFLFLVSRPKQGGKTSSLTCGGILVNLDITGFTDFPGFTGFLGSTGFLDFDCFMGIFLTFPGSIAEH